ncbi:MAG: hypothetical protein GX811_04890 [Lentisphaerae bacterium]|nr:hypothetical protein [Lentisphaerota bacterium]
MGKITDKNYDLSDSECGRTLRLAILYKLVPRRWRPACRPGVIRSLQLLLEHRAGQLKSKVLVLITRTLQKYRSILQAVRSRM